MQPSAFRSLADPIYEAFYGLTDQPFAITTDPKFFYLSASHQQAFGELLNGLRRREGMLLLTGETGTAGGSGFKNGVASSSPAGDPVYCSSKALACA